MTIVQNYNPYFFFNNFAASSEEYNFLFGLLLLAKAISASSLSSFNVPLRG
ncbi:hypothetical protein [Rickettsia tamurae]|uniref:hypothetical protein n=1 Tax=Rickettsia tamurae TaxID=334545 RepID=UPI00308210BC